MILNIICCLIKNTQDIPIGIKTEKKYIIKIVFI